MFGISPRQLDYGVLGFRPTDRHARERIEQIAACFAEGYHAALEAASIPDIAEALATLPPERQGFAFEGAAMGLGVRDWLSLGGTDRVGTFLAGAGAPHTYMVHVGIGWALARLPGRVSRTLEGRDPLLRWLIFDGWGFHDGFFKSAFTLRQQRRPRRLKGYARRAFDQGLGRALCFVEGGSIPEIITTVARFAPERHDDLWSGIGLATAYSGVVPPGPDLDLLRTAAGKFSPALAQGAAFAAKARMRAGNPTPHTRSVVEALCGTGVDAAAAATDAALEGLPLASSDGSAYETWRRRVQAHFAPCVLDSGASPGYFMGTPTGHKP